MTGGAGLGLASFVVLVLGVRLYEIGNGNDSDLKVCDRITPVISLGAVSSVISLL
jgi:hypothetical protein